MTFLRFNFRKVADDEDNDSDEECSRNRTVSFHVLHYIKMEKENYTSILREVRYQHLFVILKVGS
jgi:hypothetical protein